MKYLLWLRTLFTRPALAWKIFCSSRYNPARSSRHTHAGRVIEYQQRELSLTDILQRACACSPEQVNDMLKEFKGISFNRNLDTEVIPVNWDAREELATICYCMVRLIRPSIIVETGVGRGVTSYYILRALEQNNTGHLYSIDLPIQKPGAKHEVGKFVPTQLRSRWTLIFGVGVRELKRLRGKLEKIDMFIHDSSHTYFNQLAEYRIALAFMNKSGILVSDDVANDALLEASEEFGCLAMVTRRSKPGYIGIIKKHDSQRL